MKDKDAAAAAVAVVRSIIIIVPPPPPLQWDNFRAAAALDKYVRRWARHTLAANTDHSTSFQSWWIGSLILKWHLGQKCYFW